jgi:hypothetical protein
MSSRFIEMVSETDARLLIDKHENLVIVHTKLGCPVCEYFVPEILTPILKKFDHVKSVVIKEDMVFPQPSHPVIFFFKDGKCVQHPRGSAPENKVLEMMETFYGKPI